MVKKIIFATNDYDLNSSVVEQAFQLAEQLDAEVALLSGTQFVLDGFQRDFSSQMDKDASLTIAEDTFAKIKEQYRNRVTATFTPKGEPYIEIPKIVAEWNADLVIVGRHQKSFFKRLQDGDKEKRLSNVLKVPMVIIPAQN